MKVLINQFLDFFLPRYCTGCEKLLNADEPSICDSCLSTLKLAPDDLIESEFNRKFKGTNLVSGFSSLYIFEKEKTLQHIVHKIKYEKQFRSANLLGMKLANGVHDKIIEWKIDLIVPVPLHRLKKAERGFNQSVFIAMGLARVLSINLSRRSLKRIKYTESQTNMNLSEREKNIANAFKVNSKKKIDGKNILIVDDVITTGATISECAKVLLDSGSKKVYACSVAIAG